MLFPDVFSSLYAMSACCAYEAGVATPDLAQAESIRTREDAAKLPFNQKTPFARAAAWSANPNNPPLFLDLATRDGKIQPRVAAKWMANSTLVMVQQHASALQKMKAIQMDVGLQDNLVATNRELDALLTDLGVRHAFETYEGDHNGKVPERFDTKVLPFFAAQLEF
jgi:S-formylglutathione hydrolase FrmB